ncbi:MAG: hypothetical protein QOH47_805 [Sphingomonadales bacterium]|jgi:hypothetical protein|nr:hypothetical protein [Sphingomonadales bacterium]
MSRDLPPELADAIEGRVVRPFVAVRIELPDPVYAWSGIGTIVFEDNGATEREWTGVGELGAVDTVGESTDGSATGVKVTLFNAPEQFRDDIADQAVRGALFEIYAGALELDGSWHSVLATKMLWRGRVDDYRITDGGEQISVEVTGESRAIDQRRPSIKRFTDEWQQRHHPGDLFFQFVPQMVELSILWAKAEPAAVTASSGSSGGSSGGSGWSGPRSFSA